MRKTTLEVAAATMILITGLSAMTETQASDWYVSASIGYSDPTSKVFDDGTNGPGTPKSSIDSDTRYRIAIGRQILPTLNVELEYSTASYYTDPARRSGTGVRVADMLGIDAKLDVDLLSLNIVYEFVNESKLTPFLKAGMGSTFYNIHGDLFVSSFGGSTFGGALPASFPYSGDGSEFAYFLGAGIDYRLTDSLDITVEYRYSDLGEIATDYDSAGDRIQTELKTNDVQLGLRYSF